MIRKFYYLIGIGGVSMSAIAKYLLVMGNEVSGSDIKENFFTRELQEKGVKIYYNHSINNVPRKGIIIYNSAIHENNPEIIAAKQRGLPVYNRMQFCNSILSRFKTSIGVAGSHGKTTTVSMIAQILHNFTKNYTAFIGGVDNIVNNFYCGGNDIILSEVCEYKKNCELFYPQIASVSNVDYDHVDCYTDIEDVYASLERFLNNSQTKIVNVDDKYLSHYKQNNTITYGIKNNAEYKANHIITKDNKTFFTILNKNRNIEIELNTIGVNNVYNALNAFVVCDCLNIPTGIIQESLKKYSGVKRRNELLGSINDVKVITDYAHHPTEISSLLKIYLQNYKLKDIGVIFQSHTYSRTKSLINNFVQCFEDFTDVGIYKTYPAREEYNYLGSAEYLHSYLPNSIIINSEDQLKKHLYYLVALKKIILIIGAGDIYDLCKKIIN